MVINDDILERTCKDMIETILFCLRDATKGTIYRIGPMPELRTVRITSGIRDEATGVISWGLRESSDYNYPGKYWEDYKDRPAHALEAMAWCVEKAKSWTADNPHEDSRSVRKQLSNEIEDYHHMEPVLIKKSYLYGDMADDLEYPVDYRGNAIWKDCEDLVVAVIKIHFKRGMILRGDHSTKVIKKLSRTLGTQLLSLHIRETLSEAQKELARQRLQSCNILAHELRNTLIKLGFIFSAINAEISFLREQWEAQIAVACPDLENKSDILNRLTQLIESSLPREGCSTKLEAALRKTHGRTERTCRLAAHAGPWRKMGGQQDRAQMAATDGRKRRMGAKPRRNPLASQPTQRCHVAGDKRGTGLQDRSSAG